MQDDTIAAIATAAGEGGVAIIRVSGPDSLRLADVVFRCAPPCPSKRPGYSLVPGRVRDASGQVLDEALLLVFRAPHSFTGEDSVELQVHGGPVVARRVLQRVVEAGARPAEPGAFTRRAFLNGRIDLTQAEAVLDLIRARTDRAARAALDQLQGGLSHRLSSLYDDILAAAATLEALLDFPEEELPDAAGREAANRVQRARAAVAGLLATWREGHLLRDGATVVILGRPNAGKSSLLNALLERDRAIVSPHPGTTRDTIEETLVVEGLLLRLVDTAGLRDSACEIEQEGIRRSRAEMAAADLHVVVVDGSQNVHQEDVEIISQLDPARAIIVLNKADLARVWHPDKALNIYQIISICALSGEGLEALRNALSQRFLKAGGEAEQHAVVSERHRALLAEAEARLKEAEDMLASPASDDALAAQLIRQALEAVGRITGRMVESDMLDAIFSRFCIGK